MFEQHPKIGDIFYNGTGCDFRVEDVTSTHVKILPCLPSGAACGGVGGLPVWWTIYKLHKLINTRMRTYMFKILVGGEGGAGKTSLLRRYVDDFFDDSSVMTVGVDFFTKELNFDNIHCSLQLWDLGGQKRFRYLLDNYVMGARGALLLFDLTKMPKIGNILDWVNIVRLHDINLPIILVGTKNDLEDFIAVDDESAIHIKNAFNMINYVKTSAKTGFNVENVFEIIAKKLTQMSKY